ncbi:MAG: PqqD family protein [Acidobacteriota bacterium]
MLSDWDRVFEPKEALVAREIADEVILVPVRGKLAQLKRIFVLNPVGAYIWGELDGERDLAEIHRGIVANFEVSEAEAEADLLEYITALEEAELISLKQPGEAADAPR